VGEFKGPQLGCRFLGFLPDHQLFFFTFESPSGSWALGVCKGGGGDIFGGWGCSYP
jgi:hypothetical protein